MSNPFNNLPLETQLEILKYNPSSRRLTKKHHIEGKNIFNQMYCDKKISHIEFVNYIQENQPDNFVIYGVQDERYHESYSVLQFTKKDLFFYKVVEIKLKLDQIDYDEYKYGLYFSTYGIDVMDLLNINLDHILYYDINSTYNIIEKRQCNGKNYIQNQIDTIVKHNNGYNDSNKLYNNLIKLIYLMSNTYDTIDIDNIQSILNMDFEDIIFNGEDHIISESDVDFSNEKSIFGTKIKDYYNELNNDILNYIEEVKDIINETY